MTTTITRPLTSTRFPTLAGAARRDMAEAAALAGELHGSTTRIETLTGHAAFRFQGQRKTARVEELIWFLRRNAIAYSLNTTPDFSIIVKF